MRQAVAIKASSTAATVNSTMVAELCPYACRHTPLLFPTVHSLHTDGSRRIEGFLVRKKPKVPTDNIFIIASHWTVTSDEISQKLWIIVR
jgi:hypothetical protein